MRLLTTIFSGLVLAGLGTFSQDSGDKHLFDFSTTVFPDGADQKRLEWEAQFIEFGKKTEQNPENYIKNLISWLQLTDESQPLYYYRGNYLYGSNRYAYENFVNTNDQLWTSREYAQQGYLFNRISRSNDNLERLWNWFGDLAIAAIKPRLKQGRPERQYAQLLSDTWDCIRSKKGYQKKLVKAYDVLVETYLYSAESEKAIAGLRCEKVDRAAGANADPNLAYTSDWFYSFWVRRHHEGNTEITYAIIQEFLK